MQINTLKIALEYLTNAKITPWIWGTHGIGKSQAIAQWCQEQGYMLFDFRLNTQSDVGDILGLADFDCDSKGNKVSTKFMMPEWLRKSIDFCNADKTKKAIIFFDEINRASRRDMVGPIFQMSIDHRLHTYEFPPNLHIVVASNPDTNDYGVLNLDDKALLDRFCHIHLNPTKDEWFSYASDKKHDTSLVNFLREQPELMEQSDLESFTLRDIVKPSRRSWTAVDKLLKLSVPQDILRDLIMGLVGYEGSAAFMKFLENDDKPLTVEQVLKEYDKYAKKVKKHADHKTGGRLDILKVTCDSLCDYFTKLDQNAVLDKDEGDNLVEFLDDVPVDLLFSSMKILYMQKPCRVHFEKSKKCKKLMEKIKVARGMADAKAQTPEQGTQNA